MPSVRRGELVSHLFCSRRAMTLLVHPQTTPQHPPQPNGSNKVHHLQAKSFSESVSPWLCIPIQYSPRKKSQDVERSCVCLCGPGVGRSVCLSAEHRFILFFNLFLLLASTIHSDLPPGEELEVKTLSDLVAAS